MLRPASNCLSDMLASHIPEMRPAEAEDEIRLPLQLATSALGWCTSLSHVLNQAEWLAAWGPWQACSVFVSR